MNVKTRIELRHFVTCWTTRNIASQEGMHLLYDPHSTLPRYNVTLRVVVKEPVQVKTYTWCMKIPPRCTRYKVEMRDRLKNQVSGCQEHQNHLEADEPAALRTNKLSPELCTIITHMNPKIWPTVYAICSCVSITENWGRPATFPYRTIHFSLKTANQQTPEPDDNSPSFDCQIHFIRFQSYALFSYKNFLCFRIHIILLMWAG